MRGRSTSCSPPPSLRPHPSLQLRVQGLATSSTASSLTAASLATAEEPPLSAFSKALRLSVEQQPKGNDEVLADARQRQEEDERLDALLCTTAEVLSREACTPVAPEHVLAGKEDPIAEETPAQTFARLNAEIIAYLRERKCNELPQEAATSDEVEQVMSLQITDVKRSQAGVVLFTLALAMAT